MSKENKISIREELTSISGYDLEGNLDELIKTLEGYKYNYGSDVRVSYYHDEDSSEFKLYKNRLETDAEFEFRMDQTKLWKERMMEAELKQLKLLKEKYGQ
jgi:hypothetical protein